MFELSARVPQGWTTTAATTVEIAKGVSSSHTHTVHIHTYTQYACINMQIFEGAHFDSAKNPPASVLCFFMLFCFGLLGYFGGFPFGLHGDFPRFAFVFVGRIFFDKPNLHLLHLDNSSGAGWSFWESLRIDLLLVILCKPNTNINPSVVKVILHIHIFTRVGLSVGKTLV